MANKRARETAETSYYQWNGHFCYDDGSCPPPAKVARTHQWVREGYVPGDGVTRELDTKRAQIRRLKEQIRKREEVQKLRGEVLEKMKNAAERVKRKLAEEQAKINQKVEARKREERKRKLKKTFAEAFKVKPDPEPAASQINAPVATATDVARLLNSKNDYECLQARPGESAESIKKKYKKLAMMFHPDKCKLQGAKAAFQRLHHAYSNLSKIAW